MMRPRIIRIHALVGTQAQNLINLKTQETAKFTVT